MSLLKWSTPERRSLDQCLPLIPNEIYLDIFEYIAPCTQSLTSERLRTFARLSLVCRFFANVCLPRVFESVEFSGAIFRDDTPPIMPRNDAAYAPSRESVLCAQIAAGQPLALRLAKCVQVCRFTDWTLASEGGAWALHLFAKRYTTAMAHMSGVHRLTFSNSFVDWAHWAAIAALPALRELSFDGCGFVGGPADDEPEKLALSTLRVTNSTHPRRPFAAVDAPRLRTLVVDVECLDYLDWLPECALTEFRISGGTQTSAYVDYVIKLQTLFKRLPKSVEKLWFSHSFERDPAGGPWVPAMFHLENRLVSEVACLLPGLESLTLESNRVGPSAALRDFRDSFLENVGSASHLKYINIYGDVFRRQDGQWLGVSSSME